VSTLPYPGVATDYKPLFVALLSVADGVGIVTENIYGANRFAYVAELGRMGADIRTEGHHAVVRGVPRLSGAPVKAPDVSKPEQSVPEPLKGPLDELKKKLPKDELRKRAIERLRQAIEDGRGNVEKLRKRLEDRLGIQLPPLDKLPEAPAPSAPSIPTPSFPSPSAPAPSVPSVPDTGATGQLLDYLLAP